MGTLADWEMWWAIGKRWEREWLGKGFRVVGSAIRGRVDVSRILSPSCVTWLAASHPGWSVCKLGSCTGTEVRGRVRGETETQSGAWGGGWTPF